MKRAAMREWGLLLLAVATFFGYYAWSVPAMRGWVYYIASGALMAALAWAWRRHVVTQAGVAACALAVGEGTQQAVCGALSWRQTTGRDVCAQMLGEDVYRALGSLALAALLMLLWRQKWRQNPPA